MAIIVSYRVQPSYQDKEVVMCGAFLSREHFDKFAEWERTRPCYRRGSSFTVESCRDIPDSEYEALTGYPRGVSGEEEEKE